jgi:transcriptional regulator with XRE-family HTH domain
MNTFGEVLKRDRKRLAMTQEEFGKLLHVSQQTVANWENGQSYPRQSRRQKIMEVLGSQSELANNPPRTDFIKQQAVPPQITHAEGCWSWGPAHYECACAEIAKANGWKK